MGYTTDFNGVFKLNKVLSLNDFQFLRKLNETRRMARNVAPEYGVEGEFYVDGGGEMGQDRDDTIINYNVPPKTQPGLWCQWTPTDDGLGIEWDGNEKFYHYVEWLEYIIKWLEPRGYVLNGKVDWFGEDRGDVGSIVVVDNVVSTGVQGEDEEEATRVFFVTDGPIVDDDNTQNEELHETLEQARKHAETMTNPRVRICLVRNAFRELDGSWNYDDQENTFETIALMEEK